MQIEKLALRLNPSNPDHHIYNNNGTWWLHCTVHLADYTAKRLRLSLKTASRRLARRRRDSILRQIEQGQLPHTANSQ